MSLNYITEDYRKAINITSDIIINPKRFKQDGKINVIPLETGGGKSSITNLSLVWLAENDFDNAGTIILKERTEDCDNAVKQINNLFGKETAMPYHAKLFEVNGKYSYKKESRYREMLFKYPILIMTCEGFKNRHKKLGDFVYWTSDKTAVGMYTAGKSNTRTRLIIDEQPNPAALYQITPKTLMDIENFVQVEGSKSLFNPISNICEYIRRSCFLRPSTGEHQYWDICDCPISKELNEYFESKRKRDDIYDIFVALKLFCLNGGIVSYNDNERYKSVTVGKYIDIFDNFFDTIILDGTARINSIYDNDNFNIINIPKIKTYSNTKLHICKQLSGSRSELLSNKEIVTAALNYACKIVPKNEKCLIVTLKSVKEEFENIGCSNNIIIDHFGNITGTNKYRDYKYLFMIGIPFLPDSAYKLIYHIYHSNNDKTKPQGVTVSNGVRKLSDPDYNKTQKSILAVEIVQAINRGVCRNWNNGDTFEAFIFMLNKDEEVISLIQECMTDIEIVYNDEFYTMLPEIVKEKKPILAVDAVLSTINNHKKFFPGGKASKKEIFTASPFTEECSKGTITAVWKHPAVKDLEQSGKIKIHTKFIEFLA